MQVDPEVSHIQLRRELLAKLSNWESFNAVPCFFTYSLHKEREMRTIGRNTRFSAFKQVHNLRFYLLLPIGVTSSHCDIAFTPEI